MSTKARKRHTRKRRRLENARRGGKRIVRHKCLKGRTGTAHSKVNLPRKSFPFVHAVPIQMESARLHCLDFPRA